MEVLYHIRPYFAGIFPYIGLKHRPHMAPYPLIFNIAMENHHAINGVTNYFLAIFMAMEQITRRYMVGTSNFS